MLTTMRVRDLQPPAADNWLEVCTEAALAAPTPADLRPCVVRS